MRLIVPQEIVDLVQKLQERHGIKEAQALRALLMLGTEVYTDMEKIGIPQTVGLVNRLRDRLHNERRFYEEKVLSELL